MVTLIWTAVATKQRLYNNDEQHSLPLSGKATKDGRHHLNTKTWKKILQKKLRTQRETKIEKSQLEVS